MSSTAIGNVVYSNDTGIEYIQPWRHSEEQSRLWQHRTRHLPHASATLINNTVVQTDEDEENDSAAVNIWSGGSNLHLRNNILWATSGYAIYVPSNSQIGFQSDYNLLYATGTGQIGYWQNVVAGHPRRLANMPRSRIKTASRKIPCFVDAAASFMSKATTAVTMAVRSRRC